MNLDSNLQNSIQAVFGDPDLAGAALVRLDFILEEDEDEMHDGFSQIYSEDVEEYYSGTIGPGSKTIEYYDSDTKPSELDVFEDVRTLLFKEHDHIIDAVTVAELSHSQLTQLKLAEDNDFIWECQRKLNVFHDALPTISDRIRDSRETNFANILLVLLPNGVPVTYSDQPFDQDKVERFIETFQGLNKVNFYNRPLTGYNAPTATEYLLSPQMPPNPFGPLSVIALRSGQQRIVAPGWLPGLYGLIPYYRAFDWLNHRWEQLEDVHNQTYRLSSVFGEEEENLTPEEYRDVILEARGNWSQVNKSQDELRSFNDYAEDMPGDMMQGMPVPASAVELSYGSGTVIGSSLIQYFRENLDQNFQELQSDLDRVEEKQNSILRYLQAEVSAESSIRSLKLQKGVAILTAILLVLTLVLAVGNEFIRTNTVSILERIYDFLASLI